MVDGGVYRSKPLVSKEARKLMREKVRSIIADETVEITDEQFRRYVASGKYTTDMPEDDK